MIQNVSPIEKEFLFKSVIDQEQPVRFHGNATTASGLLSVIDKKLFAVQLVERIDNSDFILFERVTGYFDCHGKTYAFDSIVRGVKGNNLEIEIPEVLLKSLQRKYVRVKAPKHLKIYFRLSNEEIRLDYPVCQEYVSVEKMSLPQDTSDEIPITGLISVFRDRISANSTGNTIVMFRTKKPQLFEEEIISKTGKILFIPSTEGKLPKSDPYPEGRIVTESLEETFEEPDHFVNGTKMDVLLKEKKEKGITSEIWCPIVFYQYVVGYIYIYNKDAASFSISMVDYVWDFSRVLAWNLKKTGYFAGEMQSKDPVNHQPKILDMSPGGMLIALPGSEIKAPIREGSFIAVDIMNGNTKITCNAKIVRRTESKNDSIYATSFTNLNPDDLMNLYELLYRHPFTMNNPLAYESRTKPLL